MSHSCWTIENALTHEECDFLIDHHRNSTWFDREVEGGKNEVVKLPIEYPSDDTLSLIMKKYINKVKECYPALGLSFPHLVRWLPGNHMHFHHDKDRDKGQINYSSVVYLNDDFNGGETVLVAGDTLRPFKPKKGMMLLFRSKYIMHSVNKADQSRYTCIAWWSENGLPE
jgi:hypothetical protein